MLSPFHRKLNSERHKASTFSWVLGTAGFCDVGTLYFLMLRFRRPRDHSATISTARHWPFHTLLGQVSFHVLPHNSPFLTGGALCECPRADLFIMHVDLVLRLCFKSTVLKMCTTRKRDAASRHVRQCVLPGDEFVALGAAQFGLRTNRAPPLTSIAQGQRRARQALVETGHEVSHPITDTQVCFQPLFSGIARFRFLTAVRASRGGSLDTHSVEDRNENIRPRNLLDTTILAPTILAPSFWHLSALLRHSTLNGSHWRVRVLRLDDCSRSLVGMDGNATVMDTALAIRVVGVGNPFLWRERVGILPGQSCQLLPTLGTLV